MDPILFLKHEARSQMVECLLEERVLPFLCMYAHDEYLEHANPLEPCTFFLDV